MLRLRLYSQRVLEIIPFSDLDADFSRFSASALGDGATGMVVKGLYHSQHHVCIFA